MGDAWMSKAGRRWRRRRRRRRWRKEEEDKRDEVRGWVACESRFPTYEK